MKSAYPSATPLETAGLIQVQITEGRQYELLWPAEARELARKLNDAADEVDAA